MHLRDFAQPDRHWIRRTLVRDPRPECEMFMKPDIGAIGRVYRVNHPPLGPVKHTRRNHFRTAIHRQVYFTQMREKRIVGQAIQILDDPDAFGVVGRAPVPFKCFFESAFNDAFSKKLLVVHLDETDEILLVFLGVFEILAVHCETDMLLLKRVVFFEEVKNERPA